MAVLPLFAQGVPPDTVSFCFCTAASRLPTADGPTHPHIILEAGRARVELSSSCLLPIMVVMLSLMRLLGARGVLDWVVARLAAAAPARLTGLGVFAALQINLVSFAAPVATLTMMKGAARPTATSPPRWPW